MIDYIFGKEIRKPFSLAEEIYINETASCRIIGITVETRPDHVNFKTIQFLREIGATRVELGIQHLDDNILKYVNIFNLNKWKSKLKHKQKHKHMIFLGY